MAGLDRTSKAQPTSRASRFSEILKLKNAAPDDAEPLLENSIEKKPPAEIVEQPPPTALLSSVETKTKVGRRGKISKRGNPDYMQAIFHLPVKTSKRLDRELLNLGEAGVDLDRSEFAEELFQSFFRLCDRVGADVALKQFRNLGDK